MFDGHENVCEMGVRDATKFIRIKLFFPRNFMAFMRVKSVPPERKEGGTKRTGLNVAEGASLKCKIKTYQGALEYFKQQILWYVYIPS